MHRYAAAVQVFAEYSSPIPKTRIPPAGGEGIVDAIRGCALTGYHEKPRITEHQDYR
jgi:hypothetical protein